MYERSFYNSPARVSKGINILEPLRNCLLIINRLGWNFTRYTLIEHWAWESYEGKFALLQFYLSLCFFALSRTFLLFLNGGSLDLLRVLELLFNRWLDFFNGSFAFLCFDFFRNLFIFSSSGRLFWFGSIILLFVILLYKRF